MGKLVLVAVLLLVATVIGGGVFLSVFEIPAPSAPVEKVIPDARFPK